MRYGLTRHEITGYKVEGPIRTVLIRRNGPRCWFLADANTPKVASFFCHRFRRLKDAAEYAEAYTGKLRIAAVAEGARRASPDDLAFLVRQRK